MRFLMLILLTISWQVTYAAKTYSEEDFKKAVNDEVDKRLRRANPTNIAELTKEIMAKEEQIALREKDLKGREEQVQFNARELEKKIKDFELDQQRILGCVNKNKDETQKRTEQMIEIIGNMKPEKAAELLSVQDSELAVRVLAGLDAKKSSKIFNLMSKEISARLQKQYMDMKK
jgi:flagellar motility protein MotE (MotC chaperone)